MFPGDAVVVAQAGDDTGPVELCMLMVLLPLIILMLTGMWKAFAKAGEPGWAAIVPIYNWVVMAKIAGRPVWLVLLLFVPLVNIIILIVIALGVAENFGKEPGFALGLTFLPFIFWPILGFGGAPYLRLRSRRSWADETATHGKFSSRADDRFREET